MNQKALVEKAISLANQFIGTPYIRGGKDANGFDCSGLRWRIFSQMGIKFSSRFTATMLYETTEGIQREQVERGDFVFWHETPQKKRHRPIYHIEIAVEKPIYRFGKRYVKTLGSARATSYKMYDANGNLLAGKGVGYRLREITDRVRFSKAYYQQLLIYENSKNEKDLEVHYPPKQ